MGMNARIPWMLAALAALSMGCGSGVLETASIDDETQSDPTAVVADELTQSALSVAPVADAMVRSGSAAGTNYGSSANLRADADASGDVIRAYLRFDVPSTAGVIRKAVLRCYITNGSANAFDVFAAGNSWAESTINYNNQPARVGAALGSVIKVSSGAYAEVDVTAAVKAGASASFALISRSADGITCNSKEASANRPALVLTVDSTSVTLVQPTAGVTLSGSVVFAALVNGQASAADAARVDFVVDGTTYGPAVIGLGFNYVFDTTKLTNGAHQIFAKATSATGAVTTSASVSFNVSNQQLPPPAVVTMAQPSAGAVVSGASFVLAALVNGSASSNDGSRLDFLIDGTVYGPAVLGLGWNFAIDTTKLANGAHSVSARLVDPYNRTLSSASVSFSVNNQAATETWADHLGISMGGELKNLQMAKALGVKWVRFGWEMGWGPYDWTDITNAHNLGLKVLWVCQKGAGSNGHAYYDSDISAFAAYCAAAADHGVDAIEIGNEWNHNPFYMYNNVAPDSTFVSQAKFLDATTAAIRAKSATIPIMNAGWSPEAGGLSPSQAMAKVLDNSTTFKQKATLIANHPYAYSCDSPLRCDYANHPEWNAFLQTQVVYSNAKARGFDHPVWMTEIGGPSGNGNNPWNNTPYTQASQAQLFKDYIAGVGVLRGQGVPVGVLFFHTIQDGQSFTNSVEQTFGAYDANWNIKQAGQVLKDQASKPW